MIANEIKFKELLDIKTKTIDLLEIENKELIKRERNLHSEKQKIEEKMNELQMKLLQLNNLSVEKCQLEAELNYVRMKLEEKDLEIKQIKCETKKQLEASDDDNNLNEKVDLI